MQRCWPRCQPPARLQEETSDRQKTPRSFLLWRLRLFPVMLKFASKNALLRAGNNFVSNFVSRSFQFPSHACKNGNFPGFFTAKYANPERFRGKTGFNRTERREHKIQI